MEGIVAVKWNLRMAAANRGIWKASELQRQLADHGLVVSAGKMSGLWSTDTLTSIKLADLDVICAVLGCGVDELLIPEPIAVAPSETSKDAAAGGGKRAVTPRSRGGRSLPPR